jgi:hypothetical protein
MKNPIHGHRSLRLQGGISEVPALGQSACAAHEPETHMVRILLPGRGQDGAELEVKLTPEDAAHFASSIYAMAKAVLGCERKSESASDAGMAPGYRGAAA